jgi:hypothetical protein
MNIAKSLPRDANGNPITTPVAPPVVALEETYDATISSSTEITLNASTTMIEVTAIDKAIFLKWGGTASSSDFDHLIPANTTRWFMVPASITTVQFIEQAATAILAVTEF